MGSGPAEATDVDDISSVLAGPSGLRTDVVFDTDVLSGWGSRGPRADIGVELLPVRKLLG